MPDSRLSGWLIRCDSTASIELRCSVFSAAILLVLCQLGLTIAGRLPSNSHASSSRPKRCFIWTRTAHYTVKDPNDVIPAFEQETTSKADRIKLAGGNGNFCWRSSSPYRKRSPTELTQAMNTGTAYRSFIVTIVLTRSQGTFGPFVMVVAQGASFCPATPTVAWGRHDGPRTIGSDGFYHWDNAFCEHGYSDLAKPRIVLDLSRRYQMGAGALMKAVSVTPSFWRGRDEGQKAETRLHRSCGPFDFRAPVQ